MRLTAFFVFLGICFCVFSCSHIPYDDFQKVHVGDDKQTLLDEAGSPLRSRYHDGQDIWTYRFFVNNEFVYKDVTLEKEKVVAIEDSKEVDPKAAEEKEKKIEAALKEDKNAKPIIEKQ